eukprot:jgi/Tetstr1/465564/TSEL_000125.t1
MAGRAGLALSRSGTPCNCAGHSRQPCPGRKPRTAASTTTRVHAGDRSQNSESKPRGRQPQALAIGLATLSASQAWAGQAAAEASRAADTLAESMAAEGIVPVDPSNYVPSPIEVGWEIYFGAFAGAFPFAIGLYEFTKRIMIQRRCKVCKGSGLVVAGSRQLETKCPQCGGFFPWRSWKEFFSATARPGNGGVLRFPKGQTSVFYTVPDRPGEANGTNSPAAGGSEHTEESGEADGVTAAPESSEDTK